MNYYNEFDPKAAAWLRELIKQRLIPNGEVDTRSIVDVQSSDLRGFAQCHFFAGIGGWSLALQLAGWPSTEAVWTGSCPCQPFSVAGKGRGTEDERHLWPVFAELTRKCKPPTVFGEQVASKAGREWLAGVFADLEAMAYQRAGADLCAAGVGAPHIRQRLFWVAHSSSEGLARWKEQSSRGEQQAFERGGDADGMADTGCSGNECGQQRGQPHGEISQDEGEAQQRKRRWANSWDSSTVISCRDGKSRRIPVEPSLFPLAHGVSNRVGLLRGSGNAIVPQVAAEFISAYLDC